MIIEWVGCSGTGKSTLRKEVYEYLLSSGVNTQKPAEFFLGKTASQHISNERLRSLLLDFLVLPWAIYSTVKYRDFYIFCRRILKRDCSSLILRIKLLRSILRKTGLHVFLDSFHNNNRPILVDEGTVHIAHLLFANGNLSAVSPTEIEQFCKIVPTPDLIIHIMASESDVIKRTLNRKDKPVNQTSPEALKRFILLGQEVFKIMSDLNPWGEKTITLFNSDSTLKNINEEAAKITKQIISFFPTLRK